MNLFFLRKLTFTGNQTFTKILYYENLELRIQYITEGLLYSTRKEISSFARFCHSELQHIQTFNDLF